MNTSGVSTGFGTEPPSTTDSTEPSFDGQADTSFTVTDVDSNCTVTSDTSAESGTSTASSNTGAKTLTGQVLVGDLTSSAESASGGIIDTVTDKAKTMVGEIKDTAQAVGTLITDKPEPGVNGVPTVKTLVEHKYRREEAKDKVKTAAKTIGPKLVQRGTSLAVATGAAAAGVPLPAAAMIGGATANLAETAVRHATGAETNIDSDGNLATELLEDAAAGAAAGMVGDLIPLPGVGNVIADQVSDKLNDLADSKPSKST